MARKKNVATLALAAVVVLALTGLLVLRPRPRRPPLRAGHGHGSPHIPGPRLDVHGTDPPAPRRAGQRRLLPRGLRDDTRRATDAGRVRNAAPRCGPGG